MTAKVTTQKIKSLSSSGRLWLSGRTQSWYVAIACWLMLFIIVVAMVFFVKGKPATAIYADQSNLSNKEAYQLASVLQQMGARQFYTSDIQDVAQTVAKISWVDTVQVQRDWQKGVTVKVTPKKAVANFGSEHLIDVHGRVFSPANRALLDDPNLVRLYGSEADSVEIMQKMHKLNQWFLPLGLSVQDLVLTPRRTWLIRFDNGLRVMVDYERVDEKLYMLSNLLREGRLPIPLNEIQSIDLRYKNGFSITKITTQVQRRT